MNIVMLEPLAVSEDVMNDLTAELKRQGHTFQFCGEKLSEEEKRARIRDAEVAIIANSPLNADLLREGRRLKMLDVAFTGVDHVDLACCKEMGLTVCNAAGYATEATAELALGLILASLRKLVLLDRRTRSGQSKGSIMGTELKGKTVGIIGTGAIGLRVAELLQPFGCKLVASSHSQRPEALKLGIEYASLANVFTKADIITLHCPLNESTRGLVNAELIGLMKQNAVLVNCARGPIVDNKALAEALKAQKILHAGLDVFDSEPPLPADETLLKVEPERVTLTPHVAYFTREAMEARAAIVVQNIVSWLGNYPQNLVLL